MGENIPVHEAPILFVLSFALCFLSLPPIMRFMMRSGIAGRDIHKKDLPLIPEMGGIGILIGLIASGLAGIYFFPGKTTVFTSFIATILLAGLVGIIDDLYTLNARIKPLLMTIVAFPILFMHTYQPNIILPFIGGVRLNIVYPVLIPIVMTVTSNAVNMLDPFNGTMSGSCTVLAAFLLVASAIIGNQDGILLSFSLLGALVAFFIFNRYPAKVFSGDVGSLSVGAALGAIAIIGRVEVAAVVAFMPQIMNAFFGLSTMLKLYERREVPRPIEILDDGRLKARKDPTAPLTLARFVLARGPLHERDAANIIISLSFFSGILSLITTYLIEVTS